VSARLRYLALTAARTRAALPPLAATLFAAIGVYAYRENEPGASFAVTALMACALAAWAVGAVLAGEPEPQHDMATAAVGGRRARAGLEALLVTAVAAGITAIFITYPLALVALGVGNEFQPRVRAGDVVAGVLGHLCCAALGGAVGVLFAPRGSRAAPRRSPRCSARCSCSSRRRRHSGRSAAPSRSRRPRPTRRAAHRGLNGNRDDRGHGVSLRPQRHSFKYRYRRPYSLTLWIRVAC
jgi:hypothetical protein